jgi:hypothetical protein
MQSSRYRGVAAALGFAAIVLTACSGGETESPPSTTTTPSTTADVTPTEKRIGPTGGNSFSPEVKAPPAPTGVPGTNHTG